MTVPKSAFVTWNLMCMGPFERTAKALIVLWDELLLELPGPELVEAVFDLAEKEQGSDSATVAALRHCIRPVQERLPNFRFADRKVRDLYPSDTTFRALRDEWLVDIGREGPSRNQFADNFEATKLAFYGLNTIYTWSQLRTDGVQLLGRGAEDRAFRRAISGLQASSSGSPFIEMVLGAVPDLGSLTWNQVLELRAHPKHGAFREKCAEVAELLDAGIETDAARVLSDAVNFSLREVARAVRPDLRTMMLKAVVGNLPLPIPVNPISLVTGAQELLDAHAMNVTHGWVYFILDAEDTLASGTRNT